jgi:putative redox protein
MDLITIKHEEGLAFSVKIRGHKFLVDMPKDSGGEDKGPSPADLLVSALGSCLAMHMALYGNTIGLSCAGLELNLVYNIAEEAGKKRIANITVDIHMPKSMEPKEAAFLRAGQNCLIRNSLEKCPEIDVALIK